VFLLCLVLGLATVVWRAKEGADAARVHAHNAAQGRGAAVELQFSQALSAAEVLGALARQSGIGFSNFQTVALELLASRPGLATLELQPGGVVSDIVPREGNERAVGFNVLKNEAQRPGAYSAIQRRVLTATGPLTLYHGEPGIVVRVPIFHRGRDGSDSFWGFVAVSMRLSEALARSEVSELWTQGRIRKVNFFGLSWSRNVWRKSGGFPMRSQGLCRPPRQRSMNSLPFSIEVIMIYLSWRRGKRLLVSA